MKKTKRGFTLIELLIVIAIIGILASVVLVSLRNAREKATYASFKSSVSSVVPQALICLDSNNALPTSITLGTTEICDATTDADPLWPAFPTGCSDKAVSVTAQDASAGTFTFTATCVAGKCSATCDQSKCTFAGC